MSDTIPKLPFYLEFKHNPKNKAAVRRELADAQRELGKANIRATTGSNAYATKVRVAAGVGAAQVRQFSKNMMQHGEIVRNTAKHVDNLNQKQKHGIKQIAAWAIGWNLAYAAINAVKNAIRASITQFGDLEEAFLRIKWASGESNASMKNFTKQAFDVARATGVSMKEISTTARVWAQQGNSIAKSLKLTQTAAQISNVTMQETATTVNNMTGIMKAWGYTLEETQFAFDKFAKTQDNYAVTADVLADAFLRIGTLGKDAGAEFNDLIGIFTAVHTVTRRTGTEIGTAFRTIFTRFLRPATRNMIQAIAGIPTYLNATGEAVFNNTGKTRKFSDVVKELDASMMHLAQTDRDRILVQLTGVRRVEHARAMFDQWAVAMKVSEESLSALGYVEGKNNELMKTFNKAVARLGVEFSALGQDILTVLGPALKGSVELLILMVKGIRGAGAALSSLSKMLPEWANNFITYLIWPITRAIEKIKGFMEWEEALKAEAKAGSAEDGFIKDAAGKTGDLSRDELKILRAKTLIRMRELLNEGKRESAGILAKIIVAYDKILKSKKDGTKASVEDAGVALKRLKVAQKHALAMLTIQGGSGIDAAILKLKQLEAADQLQNIENFEIKRKDALNKVTEEYTKSMLSLRDAYQDVVANGLEKFAEGSANLIDIVKELSSVIRKNLIKDALGAVEDSLGVFSFLSAITTHPVARAHEKGAKTAAEIIIQAHVDGVKKAFEQNYIRRTSGVGAGVIPGVVDSPLQISVNQLTKQKKSIESDLEEKQIKIDRLMEAATPYSDLGTYSAGGGGISQESRRQEGIAIAGMKVGMESQRAELKTVNETLNKQTAELIKQTDLQNELGSTLDSISSLNKSTGDGGSGAGGVFGNLFSTTDKVDSKTGKKIPGSSSAQMASNFMGGVLSGMSEYSSARAGGASVGMSALKGGMSGIGAMALMVPDPTGMTQLGGAALIIGSMLLGGGKKKETETRVKEQTKQITSRINVTNKQLEIVNRNLLGIRRGFEGWVMQESYYLRQRSRAGVNVQSEFALNMKRGFSNV